MVSCSGLFFVLMQDILQTLNRFTDGCGVGSLRDRVKVGIELVDDGLDMGNVFGHEIVHL